MAKASPIAAQAQDIYAPVVDLPEHSQISAVQRSAQAALRTIKTQHTAMPSTANEATPEIIAEHIEPLTDVCVLGAIETVLMCVAHEIPGSNDEVERRGFASPANQADLSQSSTPSLAHRRRSLAIARTDY